MYLDVANAAYHGLKQQDEVNKLGACIFHVHIEYCTI